MIVDPGMDSVDRIAQLVTDHDLSPVAVLLTHGHFDHASAAAEIADRYGAGCWVGPGDEGQLIEPLSGLPAEMHSMVGAMLGPGATDGTGPGRALPARMLPFTAGPVRLAGLDFVLEPAPGHTPGSTLIVLDYPDDGPAVTGAGVDRTVVFTGDVVFAGSIGRTDLPGGDAAAMDRTLTEVVLRLPDEAILLPGHGPQTTLGRERVGNPFLTRFG